MNIAAPYLDLPYADWQSTRDTLHLYLQVVGKIRLALHPKLNHWWHVPFYLSTQGLTTGPIPYHGGLVELEFNFTRHTLDIKTSADATVSLDLTQQNVAQFFERVPVALAERGVAVTIHPAPYDVPHIPERSFADCQHYDTYDPAHVAAMWQMLISVNNAFQIFRGRFIGKSTPVHLFWHHFDLALTRFSGRPAPLRAGISQVEHEAYSHEVISFGFWFGDGNMQEPAFYAYGFPPPAEVYGEALEPGAAFWSPEAGMSLLRYADVQAAADPQQAILDYMESSYRAYAKVMQWDINALALASTLQPRHR